MIQIFDKWIDPKHVLTISEVKDDGDYNYYFQIQFMFMDNPVRFYWPDFIWKIPIDETRPIFEIVNDDFKMILKRIEDGKTGD